MLNKSKIISKLLPHALEIQVKYKLLPSVIISQAILETGWLQHCRGNNIFGIKWTRDCGFEFNELSTYEWIDGIKTPKICLFRKYENLSESFSDYAELITSLKRYRPVVAAPNYKEACKELYKCGYCTDPEYPLKLISIIESNELYKHDSIPLLCSQEENNNVELLQTHMNLLNILDYEDKVLIIDGIMGPRTKSAVEKFIDLCSLNIVNWDIKEILKITGAILIYNKHFKEIDRED